MRPRILPNAARPSDESVPSACERGATPRRRSIVRALLPILPILLCLTACSDEPRARSALEDAGFADIEFTGWSWTSCGREDTYKTHFAATNVRGKRVTGVVCSGWLKGSTIRFD